MRRNLRLLVRRHQAALVAAALATGMIAWGHASRAYVDCPADMVRVKDFCIDRYEAAAVDKNSKQPLSPFYPPEYQWLQRIHDAWESLRHTVGPQAARAMPLPEVSELQRSGKYTPQAVSRSGVVPQGYLSHYSAKRLCEAASKRLCTLEEWTLACRGQQDAKFPYGSDYKPNKCNVGSQQHPAAVLHGLSSSGHLDPRLNLLMIAGDAPVLRETGSTPSCASRWGSDAVYDMVGNLDEWVASPEGIFKGGFYARRSTAGCEAEVKNHSATYFDYSTGTRCCRDVD